MPMPFSSSSNFTRTAAFEGVETNGSSRLLESLDDTLISDSTCLRGRSSRVLRVVGWTPLTARFRLAVEVEGPASAGLVGVCDCPFVTGTLAARCIYIHIS